MPWTAGPAQIDVAVLDHGAHLDVPPRVVGVAANQADWLLADLHGDVHVVQRFAIRDEVGPREIVPFDDDAHQPVMCLETWYQKSADSPSDSTSMRSSLPWKRLLNCSKVTVGENSAAPYATAPRRR